MKTANLLPHLGAAVLALGICAPAAADGPFYLRAVSPCRLVDTRQASGPFGGPALANGVTRAFAVEGRCLPAIPSSATAVYVTVTAITPSAQGHLRLFEAGASLPATSSLNFAAGSDATTNGTVVNLSSSGLSVYAALAAAGTVHVTIDILGWYGAAGERGALRFVGVPPCRLVDTRNAAGSNGGPILSSGQTRVFPVTNRCGIPAQARAIAVTATAVAPSSGGYLTLAPGSGMRSGSGTPTTVTVAFPAGVTARAAPSIALLEGITAQPPTSGVPVYANVSAGGTVHFVLDVTGFYKE